MARGKEVLDKLWVVIVTFKRYGELVKTIDTVEREGISKSSIIIVDNTPSDSKKDLDALSECHWIIPPENVASAGGFSLGMRYAIDHEAAWVLLFNDDSRPKSGALESLRRGLVRLEGKRVGLLKIGNLDSRGNAILLDWKGVRKPRYVDPSNIPTKTDLVTFDGCLVSGALIRQIGTCDPAYFMGTYEFDYCLKAAEKGFGVYTIPNGLIEDGKLGSVGGTPPWRQYYNTRNHLWLGISKKDWKIIGAWVVRELKFTYAILRWENQKILRLKLKVLATAHALTGIRGKILDPTQTNRKH